MVVREIVGRVIYKVPIVGSVAKYTTKKPTPVEDEVLVEDSVAVVEPESPRQRIHKQLLKNRTDRTEAFIDDDEMTLRDESSQPDHPHIDGVRETRVEEYLSKQSMVKQQTHQAPQTQPSQPGLVSYLVTSSAKRLLGRKPVVPEPEPEAEEVPRVSVAKRLLDTDIKMDLFLDSLDNDTKRRLLQELSYDLDDGEVVHYPTAQQQQQFYNHHYSQFRSAPFEQTGGEPKIGIDKFQEVLLIMIKFFVVCFKLSMPVFRYFYIRFMDNRLFFFNQRNSAKLFDFVLSAMRILENHLSKNEDTITHLYNRGNEWAKTDSQMERLYNELQTEAKNYFDTSSIKSTMVDYVLGRMRPMPTAAPPSPRMSRATFEENLHKFEAMNASRY
ncbi:hypothetical protein DICA3_E01288 [Diutina catenulata]